MTQKEPEMLQLPKSALTDYVDFWRGEGNWPLCEGNVLLVLYDILLLCNESEDSMKEVLGNDGVQYICDTMNSPVIMTATALAVLEHLGKLKHG